MNRGELVNWLRHGQELVDTMAAPYAADVVGLLKDDASYGAAGDHGGHQKAVQEIPIVFAGGRTGSRDSRRRCARWTSSRRSCARCGIPIAARHGRAARGAGPPLA